MDIESLRLKTDTELNELSATKVMGWRTTYFNRVVKVWVDSIGERTHNFDEWNPTTDMNDAMELLEGQEYALMNTGGIKAQIFKRNDEGRTIFHVISNTAPRAITIASILAKEE